MFALIAAAAVTFTSPHPVNSGSWFVDFGAHPKEGALTLIAAEIVVDAKGRPETCSAKAMLGMTDWAPFTCKLILSRGQFRAATIGDQKVYGVFRVRNAWLQSGYLPSDLPVWDFELTLNKTPPGVRLPLLKKIQFVVDQTGQITDCAAAGDWNAELAAVACTALPKTNVVHPAKTRAGETVASVQDAAVRFVADTQVK
jgi:hypothetical protein